MLNRITCLAIMLAFALVPALSCTPKAIGDECVSTADCGDDYLCINERCRRACNSSADCDPGEQCTTGYCMPGEVRQDASAGDASAGDASAGDASAGDARTDDARTGDDSARPDSARPDTSPLPDVNNVCGGTSVLVETLGGACNTCGIWVCSGTDALVCDEPVCLECLEENFDISQVVEWRTKGRPAPTSWPVVSGLTVTAVERRWLYFDFDQPETWVGDGYTCSEFYVIYRDAGVWVGQIADYLGCDESQHNKDFAGDWGPENQWYRISPGDPVGFLVTSQSLSGGAHIPMYERTSVFMMCW